MHNSVSRESEPILSADRAIQLRARSFFLLRPPRRRNLSFPRRQRSRAHCRARGREMWKWLFAENNCRIGGGKKNEFIFSRVRFYKENRPADYFAQLRVYCAGIIIILYIICETEGDLLIGLWFNFGASRDELEFKSSIINAKRTAGLIVSGLEGCLVYYAVLPINCKWYSSMLWSALWFCKIYTGSMQYVRDNIIRRGIKLSSRDFLCTF